MTDWQPIETAPKDGAKFNGLVENDEIEMYWDDELLEFISGYEKVEPGMGWYFDDDGLNYKDCHPMIRYPTHWRPLDLPAARDGVMPGEQKGE